MILIAVICFGSQRGCRYRHQYPIGFRATKSQYKRDWTMTIEDGGDLGPQFKVESNDGHVFVGSSPTRPWTDVCIQLYGKQSKTRVSGPYQFGFTDPFLQAVLASLDPLRDEDIDSAPARPDSGIPRGIRFGERKRGRPRRPTEEGARMIERALELGMVQIITDVAPMTPRPPRPPKGEVKDEEEDGKEEEAHPSGRPKRKTTMRTPVKPEQVDEEHIVITPKSSKKPTSKGSSSTKIRVPIPQPKPTPKVKIRAPPPPPPPEPDPEEEIVDCVCDMPDLDDGTLMVSCDHCYVWYHSRCVDYALVMAVRSKKKKKRKSTGLSEEMQTWMCPRCR
ncbi:hypothetical protein BC829DRAFT_3650 [Chytridium lagenaria]|nr:hypothetical protein BC829DRAFT_3650 [Chytridium lagenaria]